MCEGMCLAEGGGAGAGGERGEKNMILVMGGGTG